MSASPRKNLALAPQRLGPAPHEVDWAPQLLVVTLTDAALLALERALDSAHPLLGATKRVDRPPPVLNDTEHVALEILQLTERLAALLRRYVATVDTAIEASLDDLHDNLF
jgi:hypothetical protein